MSRPLRHQVEEKPPMVPSSKPSILDTRVVLNLFGSGAFEEIVATWHHPVAVGEGHALGDRLALGPIDPVLAGHPAVVVVCKWVDRLGVLGGRECGAVATAQPTQRPWETVGPCLPVPWRAAADIVLPVPISNNSPRGRHAHASFIEHEPPLLAAQLAASSTADSTGPPLCRRTRVLLPPTVAPRPPPP